MLFLLSSVGLLSACLAIVAVHSLGEAAIEGLGIAMQPTFIAGEANSRGELVPILTDYQWPVTPAWAAYPPTRHLSFRVRQFIDFLAEYFAGTPYWDQDCCPE